MEERERDGGRWRERERERWKRREKLPTNTTKISLTGL